ncbi:hypothetical protein GGI12_003187 [Dipsacomyces acuminosporus]|nr:hypothetical protein GGI12_003187 [Dipsacomyces acuminosporus]
MDHVSPLQISFENLSYSVKIPAKQPAGEGAAGPSLPYPLKMLRSLFASKKYEDKSILSGLSGTFQPGKLTAILGPSGSGKTTLLNLLSGQALSGTYTGSIWVNGRPATGSSLRQLAGYVHQDDVILATQTVQEAIEMSTVLRPAPDLAAGNASDEANDQLPLPATASYDSRTGEHSEKQSHQSRLCSLAVSLFELDKCKETMIGNEKAKGVSGGELKRTAIAMEWVTQSPILFLDEPTSGLDAHSALVVTHHLKEIARTGRTVVAVLHQPSSEMFELVDDLLILCEGQVAYLSERAHLVEYLEKLGHPCGMYTNPADHIFNDVLFDPGFASKASECSAQSLTTQATLPTSAENNVMHASQRAARMISAWSNSSEANIVNERIRNPELSPIQESQFRKMSAPMVQLKYLLKRSMKNALRNKLVLRIRIGQAIGFGLIIGLVFLHTHRRPPDVQLQNFSGALFFGCVNQFVLTMMSVVNVFVSERVVFLREWQGGYYTLLPYFFAKNIVELPIQIVSPVIYSCISYWLLGFRHDVYKFFLHTAVLIVVSLCGFSAGILLGSSFSDLSTILAVVPAIFLPFLLFGGLLVNTGNSTVWLRWLQWLSPIKYGYSALAINQFKGYVVNGVPIGDRYLDVIQLGPFSVGVNIAFVAGIALLSWAAAIAALVKLAHKGVSDRGSGSRKKLQADLLGPPDPRFIR